MPEPMAEISPSTGIEEPQAPSPLLADDDPFSSMMERFDEAAQMLGLDPDLYVVLRQPDREFKFAVPYSDENGELQVAHGFRIRHNLSLGPCLGGLRLDARLTREELRALAAWTTWKCAALNIPFGGSMGGVDYDPRGRSAATTEKVVRRYTAGLLDLLGPDRDILIPDLHCDERIMAWCMDTYSMHVRHTENAVVVGKPLGLGGTHGRDAAIGRGARVLMEKRLSELGITGKARVAVQGAGTVAAQVMRQLTETGHKVVAISDLRGGVTNADGVDVDKLLAHRSSEGSIAGSDLGDAISNEELLSMDVDVLIPAATANQITGRNAHQVGAKLIVEAANGPTTKRADAILRERGISVVPDLLGNSGAVIIAYFEWVQNRMGFAWTRDRIDDRIDRMVLEAYERADKAATKHEVGLRLATCMLGVDRVAYFDQLRGTYG